MFAAAIMLTGCAGVTVKLNAQLPSIDEFPEQEVSFRINGNTDNVLRDIEDFLWQKGLPSIVTVRAPKTFIVTTYIQEPEEANARRVRRTAFRLALTAANPNDKTNCSTVSVVSITKSRGIREEVWSIQDTDMNFTSSKWPELKNLLEERACK